MRQGKFTLTENQMEFLSRHRAFGFKDRSAVLRHALAAFQDEAERRLLEESAELYAELYPDDADLQALTESAAQDWPE